MNKCKSSNYRMGSTNIPRLFAMQIMINFATTLDDSGMTSSLPFIQTQMNITRQTAQWLNTIYYIGLAAFSIPCGKIVDRFGCINVLQLSLLIFAICNICVYFTKQFYLLIIIRAVVGCTAAFIYTTRNAMISKYPQPDKASLSIQLYIIIQNICKIVINLLIGYIIKYLNWKYIYLISFCFALFSIISLIPFYNNDLVKSKAHFDVFGILTLTIFVSCFCLGFTLISYKYYITTAIVFIVSIIGLVAFIKIESIHKDPILPLYLMKNPVIDLSFQNVLTNIVAVGTGWIIPQYLYDSVLTGYVQAGNLIAATLTSTALIYIQKKVVSRYILYGGYTATLFSIFSMTFTLQKRYAFVIVQIIYNLVFSFCTLVVFSLIMLSVSDKHKAKTAAIPPTSRCIGSSISLCLFSSLITIVQNYYVSKGYEQFEAFKIGMKYSYGIMVVLIAFQLINTITRIGNQRNEQGRYGYKEQYIREIKETPDIAITIGKQNDFVLDEGFLPSDDEKIDKKT